MHFVTALATTLGPYMPNHTATVRSPIRPTSMAMSPFPDHVTPPLPCLLLSIIDDRLVAGVF